MIWNDIDIVPDSESESDTSPSSISESSDPFAFPLKQKSIFKQQQGGRCIVSGSLAF